MPLTSLSGKCPSRNRRRRILLLALIAALPFSLPAVQTDLLPVPAQTRRSDRPSLRLSAPLRVAFEHHDDARLRAAVQRAAERLGRRAGRPFPGEFVSAAEAQLVIDCAAAGSPVPRLGEDESYSLRVDGQRAVLRAPTAVGVLRGLESFLQLVQLADAAPVLPAVEIDDHPRFAWRGLMIDVVRHWQPLDVLERNLDVMAAVKLNVLHLHLTDDQGFRIESRRHPELQTQGSDGHFFTQEQIRELLAYAHARGIRVIPEFDLPGHATSWVVSHPELASLPGPYHLERRWGVFDPVLDPTQEPVYGLLEDFLGEMCALFPDEFFHVGGDENNGVQWKASPRIQAFIREHGLKDNEGLHAYFNRRVFEILRRQGKRPVGWDEILGPDLPREAVVHSWRGPAGLATATAQGHAALLSNGYYIDLGHPAAAHYLNDPAPADAALSAEQRRLILGGEATMWSEWVSPDSIDSRIWPRTAAIAERLWSPAEVRDVDDLYRRLAVVDDRLVEAGSKHRAWPQFTFEKTRPDLASAWRVIAQAVEPVKDYRRPELQPEHTQLTPLEDLADWSTPDSASSRSFHAAVERGLSGPGTMPAAAAQALRAQLQAWAEASDTVLGTPEPDAGAAVFRLDMARRLRDVSRGGLEALEAVEAGRPLAPDRAVQLDALLLRAARPSPSAVEFPFLGSLHALVRAAADPAARGRPGGVVDAAAGRLRAGEVSAARLSTP